MPAVSADTLSLPRLPEVGPEERARPVRSVTTAPSGTEGEGFPVRRAFAGVDLADLDPFIHLDQMGSVDYAPGEPRGTSWHPHRGFETVTYMLDGAMEHQDSHGGGGLIADGATQWMTAGAGILHIETPPEQLVIFGGLFHGLQLWVNLPAASKLTEPRYQNLEGAQATLAASPDGGALVRIIAGEVAGHAGPGCTHTPIAFTHVTLAPDSSVAIPWPKEFNGLVYALSGRGSVGDEHWPLMGGQLAVMGSGDRIVVSADASQPLDSPNLEVIVLGGRPIGEPIAWYGPFVMNTKAEVSKAMDDYRAGRLGVVPPGALQPHHA